MFLHEFKLKNKAPLLHEPKLLAHKKKEKKTCSFMSLNCKQEKEEEMFHSFMSMN